MNWLEAISSAFGVGTGGAVIALAIYAGSGSLEAEVRPEAKKQIADFLKSVRIRYDLSRAVLLVCHLFDITFGERQLSWKCFRRSFCSSLIFVGSIVFLVLLKHKAEISWPRDPAGQSYPVWMLLLANLLPFLLLSMLPDFVSLAKARLLLRRMSRVTTLRSVVALIAVDIVLSYVISMTFYYGIHLPINGLTELCDTYQYYEGPAACGDIANPVRFVVLVVTISADMLWVATHGGGPFSIANVIAFAIGVSTLLTSVWTVLVLVAVSILRLAIGLNYAFGAARWLFDVDAHPIRTIGKFISGIVWLGSITYGLV